MNNISKRRLGFAFGITGALLYLGCVIVMVTVGREGTIQFFNSILHGLDVDSIIRMKISWWKALIGLAETFILSWLIGFCVASFYNISPFKEKHS